MKKVESKDIVKQLTTIFVSSAKSQVYYSQKEQYIALLGWCGANSPVSRPAFLKTFGSETVESAEKEARAALEAAKKEYMQSDWNAWKNEADNKRGTHVWAYGTGAKATSLKNELKTIIGGDKSYKQLLFIDKTIFVNDLMNCDLDALVKEKDIKGGTMTEEDELINLVAPYDLYCTKVAAVTDGKRACYIDPSGCDYARYIYFTETWEIEFDEFITALKTEKEARERKEEEKEQAKRTAIINDYRARCRKWEKKMKPVTELEETERQAKTREERKAIERKIQAIRRANILSMCKAAFPGIKFSLRKRDGWGESWELTYTDGVPVKELEKKTDLDLFQIYTDTFDGYTDYTDVEVQEEEFCGFARKYMGTAGNRGIKIEREMSKKTREELTKKVLEAIPEMEGDNNGRGFNRADMPDDIRNKIDNLIGWGTCECQYFYTYSIIMALFNTATY